jgi:hypothetical protein
LPERIPQIIAGENTLDKKFERGKLAVGITTSETGSGSETMKFIWHPMQKRGDK